MQLEVLRNALISQYLAGLAMLEQQIKSCPDDVWISGQHPRTFWRIAYHTIYYTHLYANPKLEDFQPWEHHREHCPSLWENPPHDEPYTQSQTLDYLRLLQDSLSNLLTSVDLESSDSGFSWYPNISKLEHQIMNIRHLQGHVGQLSELLMAHGIDTDWVSRGMPLASPRTPKGRPS